MYPGVMFKKKLTLYNKAWNTLAYLAAFGVLDTIGKKSAGYKKIVKLSIVLFLFLFRFFLAFIYINLAIGGE